MAALHLLFNAVTVIFIAATMFAAGLGSTLAALRAAFTNVSLLLLVLLANLVVVPLLGWGLAALFHLTTAPFIALILTASSPGGPFGAKLGMVQHGDITTGAAMQVLLAAVGSITFGITANALLTAADVGGGISLDVGALVRTVAVLQLVPFAIGLLLRRTSPRRDRHRLRQPARHPRRTRRRAPQRPLRGHSHRRRSRRPPNRPQGMKPAGGMGLCI